MARLAPDTDEQLAIRYCAKCGVGLPAHEEGFCEACGMPYGPITTTMKRITPEMVRQERLRQGAGSASYPTIGPTSANVVVAVVIVVALILAAILLVILLTTT